MNQLKCVEYKTGTSGLVLTMPHSGTHIPNGIHHHLDLSKEATLRTVNAGVDLCVPYVTGFSTVADGSFGLYSSDFRQKDDAARIWTTLPRAVVDVNRGTHDVDYLTAEWGGETPKPHGLIWRSTVASRRGETENILVAPYSRDALSVMLKTAYDPFHDAVKDAIGKAKAEYGAAILLDLHSLPACAVSSVNSTGEVDLTTISPDTPNVTLGIHENAYIFGDPLPIGLIGQRGMPDVILMDSDGTSCNPAVSSLIMEVLSAHNLTVQRSAVAPSTYSTSRSLHSDPANGMHVAAVEVVGHRGLEPKRVQGELRFVPEDGVVDQFNCAFAELFGELEKLVDDLS